MLSLRVQRKSTSSPRSKVGGTYWRCGTKDRDLACKARLLSCAAYSWDRIAALHRLILPVEDHGKAWRQYPGLWTRNTPYKCSTCLNGLSTMPSQGAPRTKSRMRGCLCAPRFILRVVLYDSERDFAADLVLDQHRRSSYRVFRRTCPRSCNRRRLVLKKSFRTVRCTGAPGLSATRGGRGELSSHPKS